MEHIMHAAIVRTDNVIVFDRDHAKCIIRSPKGTCKEGAVQGFLTNGYRFVRRVEAAHIAFKAHQISKWKAGQPLVSEELWSNGGKYKYNRRIAQGEGYVLKGDTLENPFGEKKDSFEIERV